MNLSLAWEMGQEATIDVTVADVRDWQDVGCEDPEGKHMTLPFAKSKMTAAKRHGQHSALALLCTLGRL
jgi:hypothetical protein